MKRSGITILVSLILTCCSSEPRGFETEGPLDWSRVTGQYNSILSSPYYSNQYGTLRIVMTSSSTIEIQLENLSDTLEMGNINADLVEDISSYLRYGVSLSVTDNLDSLRPISNMYVTSVSEGEQRKVAGQISTCDTCTDIAFILYLGSPRGQYKISGRKRKQ